MPPLPLGREWIAARLPHQGRMCLLDSLLEFDPARILCAADSHRDAGNPLRAGGRLGAACALEYAGQAIALHGTLLATQAPPRPGMLVAVRELHLAVAALDELPGSLRIACERLDGDARTMRYGFEVSCDGVAVATGRATIVCGLPVGFAA
jgi:predicted hotdog family 3-hydroxylacyl-ACP dehydratase